MLERTPPAGQSEAVKIELRHLRYFIAVAEELHFGRAAERLDMAQPPLSQQIRQLEHHLGARLLDRSSRRVALTPAGSAFLLEARDILRRVERAVDVSRRIQRGETGELRIGITRSTPLSRMIPRTIFAFRQRRPAVQLLLDEMNSLQQIDALLERRLQLGIVRGNVVPELLTSTRLFSDPLVAVLRSDHPVLARLGGRKRLPTAALADTPFVLFSRAAGAGIHDHVIALCRAGGFAPRVAQEAGETSTIVGLVSAGLGVSILPASSQHIQIEGVRYVPLADPDARSEIHAVYRRDERSPLVAEFVRELRLGAREHAQSR